ncbi:MAG: hypothetical protein LBP52_00265 [Burkholderiaceae bacterium]|nr:hypothetical protein [Burkholderiaceae bacterium]
MADANLNTLVDYRYAHRHEAGRGQHGMESVMFGAVGVDITHKMPVGTVTSGAATGQTLFDLLQPGARAQNVQRHGHGHRRVQPQPARRQHQQQTDQHAR